jgi:hypothetical protein
MRKNKSTMPMRALHLGGFAIILCAAGFQTARASTLSLVPEEPSVNVGDSVAVDLDISGLSSGTAVGAFDITVDYSSLFTLNNVEFGDPTLGDQLALLGISSLTDTIPGANSEELIEVSFNSVATLDSLQASDFTLAVLNFTAESAGTGSFTLGSTTLSDASGHSLGYSVSNASIGANSVAPEPSTLVPLVGMMAVMIALMRKRMAGSPR